MTSAVLNARQEQLVYSKKLHPHYQGDRPSPIWTVSPNAIKASATNRVTQLAEPKRLHPNYQPSRGVSTASFVAPNNQHELILVMTYLGYFFAMRR